VVAAKAILDLQLLVSRYVDPLEPAVVSGGQLSAGSAFSIIAERATFEGTVRTLSEEVRSLIEEKMERLVKGACEERERVTTWSTRGGIRPWSTIPRRRTWSAGR
jgi:metal-dependent amidase/aminoacylase/carboxypeptidase family protein